MRLLIPHPILKYELTGHGSCTRHDYRVDNDRSNKDRAYHSQSNPRNHSAAILHIDRIEPSDPHYLHRYLYECHAFEIRHRPSMIDSLRCSPQRQRVTDPPSELSSWSSSSSSSSSSSAVEWVSCCNDGGGWVTVVDREVDFLGGWVRTLRRAGAAIASRHTHTHNGSMSRANLKPCTHMHPFRIHLLMVYMLK